MYAIRSYYEMDCLECYSSGRGICETAKAQLPFYPESSLNNYQTLSTKKIAEAAQQGDAFALQLFTQAADYLGLAIASMANVFNPEAIILGSYNFV